MTAAQAAEPLPTHELELEALFEANQARVLSAAFRITGNAGDAEDVLQTVFLRLARRPAGDESAVLAPNPGAYLHRAAVNAALDLVRQRRRKPNVPLEASPAELRSGAGDDPEQRRREREIEDWLRVAVTRLTPQAAEVFALHVFEGRDHQEIADTLAISKNAVAVILHRARRQLRRDFDEFEGDIA